MTALKPHFMIDVTLYGEDRGGRREPIAREGFACPCKIEASSNTIADCRLVLDGQQIAPGETKRVGICFLHEASASLFQSAGHFYFWDGRIIGEATVTD